MFNNLPLEAYLSKYFNFPSFRSGQRQVVEGALSGNRDILAIMPTGRGKSLCYQLPGLLLPGTTLVISPLVALMKDQVDSLQAIGIDQATFLNSQLTPAEQRQRLGGMVQGRYKLVYVAPERLRNQAFTEVISRVKVSLLVVDEAHCVSQWGHDFRPDYLWIRQFVSSLRSRPRVLGLTATATVAVQKDILWQLGIPQAEKVVSSSDRPNLFYRATTVHSDAEKRLALKALINKSKSAGKEQGCGIIYVATRKDCEQVAGWINSQLGIRAGFYHGGMPPQERTEVQELFLREELPVVVATNAFGMGIDKANIRFVVHYSLPASLESYYQEVGRAGRDGQPAECLLLFAPKDKSLQQWMIKNDTLTVKELQAFLLLIKGSAAGSELYLTYEQLAEKGLEETKVRVAVSELERVQVLHLLERDGAGVRIEVITDTLDREILQRVLERINRMTEERHKKLEVMTRWIHTSRCRREALLAYFGEEKPGATEKCCDNCAPQGKEKRNQSADEVSRAGLAVLNCVAQLSAPLGRNKITDILLGSRRKEILEGGLNRLPAYGQLAGLPGREILQVIDRLIGDGYLASKGAQYPVVILTNQGKEAGAQALQNGNAGTEESAGLTRELTAGAAKEPAYKAVGTVEAARGLNHDGSKAEALKLTIAQLMEQGLSQGEIAGRVDRSEQTVTKYIAQLVQEGKIPVERLVPWEVRQQIYLALEKVGMARLRPIKELLPENVNYADIRYVIASLRQNLDEEKSGTDFTAGVN